MGAEQISYFYSIRENNNFRDGIEMKPFFKIVQTSACLLLFVPLFALAGQKGPLLQLDSDQVFLGTFYEGKDEFVKHAFSYKNIGDETVEITLIKPGCNCESVKADTALAPGQTGHLSVTVDIRDQMAGPFEKVIIVNFNALNFRKAKFKIMGIFKPIIEVDPASIVLPTMEKKDTLATVTLSTDKNDLQVTDVFFQADNPSAAWATRTPVKFIFKNPSKKNKDGKFRYSLTVFYFPIGKESIYGNFLVRTNQPQKAEFKITGVLDPKK